MKSRISKLKSLVKNTGIDGLLLTNHKNCEANMYYAVGIKDVFPAYLLVDENSALLFCHDERLVKTKDVE
jgi:Xaa-Pro aminopeptidase